jgi:Spy/CpxP family protein refolding chaperone
MAAEAVTGIPFRYFPNGEEQRMMMRFTNRNLSVRRTLLLATILAAGSCGIWAQAAPQEGPPPPDGQMRRGPNAERELGQLTQTLSLTPDQQTQVKGLLQERRGKMEALRAGGAQPTREQMEGIRKDTDAKINALLNEDQKAKFAAWQQQRMQQRRGPGGDAPPQPPPPPPNA